MNRILYTAQEALIAFFLLIPIFYYLNKHHFIGSRQTLLYLLFATYMTGVYAVVGLPDIAYFRFRPNINLEPFLYMFSDLSNTVLNVVLFLPLGLFLPILWEDFSSLWKTVLVGFLTSLTIELLQIFTFRATDINDLMTNTLGTLIGFFFGLTVRKYLHPLEPEKKRSHIPMVFGIAFLTMFFLHPFFSSVIYRIFS